MIIVEKNEGPKIPYSVKTTKVTFDDDLTANLAKREKDWAEHIDICADDEGNLVIGAAVGRRYVAEIDIPARRYETTTETIDGEEVETQTPIPLDMNTVTLSLWAIEEE